MSSFIAQATHFSILILLVLAILDCTCRAASHFRFDEASGFIFAVREGLSSSEPHIYRVASVSLSIDFRADFWQLYDALVRAIDAGSVTSKSEAHKPRIRLSSDDESLIFNADIRGGPSIDSLADSIESAWNSGEFKRAANLFSAAHKFSASEFRNSFRLVAQLFEYLASAKLYEEGLVAADILVAVYPNLFQAHLYRTRALTMLSLWEAAAQELAVVRRLQPSLQLLSAYAEEISSNAAKDALASQGARAYYHDPVDSYRDGNSSSYDVRVDSWTNILRGLGSREFIPYVIFDAVVCSCFVALYSYMCKIKAATAKAAKCSVAPIASVAALAHAQPAALLRRSRA